MAKTAWCNILASCSIDRVGGASTGLVYDLTDSVDSARALAPRDVRQPLVLSLTVSTRFHRS